MNTTYHFIGIGGIGMSALAKILLEKGHRVTGSDLHESTLLKQLKEMGAVIHIGHNESNLPEEGTLVYSTDIGEDNPELSSALKYGLKTMHRSELLAELMEGKTALAVAGTHGKTTTTSLLAHLLLSVGVDPGYAVGGVLPESNTNGSLGAERYFVAEADESDGSFLRYRPQGAIITNIDLDHLSYYRTEENLLNAFCRFANQVQDFLFYCGEDQRLQGLHIPGISYGFTEGCALKGENFCQEGLTISFDASFEGKRYQGISVNLPGYHSALNALAVFGVGLRLGFAEERIKEALASFKGVKRRSELKVHAHHVQVFDDYGHHPTEIKATIKAFKNAFPERKLLVYFQPHRHTRTRDCLQGFTECFTDADEVVLTDIYAAGEAPILGIDSGRLLAALQASAYPPCSLVKRTALLEDAKKRIRPFDIVLTLGAGDITKLSSELAEHFLKEAPQKLRLLLLKGGRSSEHEISLLSAENISRMLDKEVYEVEELLISKEGAFDRPDWAELVQKSDIVFPVLHGPNGEDGTVQGFIKVLGKAYAGCSTLSSAIAMHKGMTKKLAEREGVAVVPFLLLHANSYRNHLSELPPFPLYVKPVRLGSSVGVRRVDSRDSLLLALEEAFKMDEEVVVEQEIKGREIEFAIFGYSKPMVFPPGEVKSSGACYGYEEKYLSSAMETVARADLPNELMEKGCREALKAYRSIGCDGFARVDFFLLPDGTYLLNEINPIPGFTAKSLYPEICKANGLSVQELLNELVMIGRERKRREERKRL